MKRRKRPVPLIGTAYRNIWAEIRVAKDFDKNSSTGGIQEAITDAAATGAPVWLPPGTYAPSVGITIANNRIYVFASKGAIIRPTGAFNVFTITGNDVTLEGFEIDCNDVATRGIYANNCSGLKLKDLKVHNGTGTGIWLSLVDDFEISGVESYNAGYPGCGITLTNCTNGRVETNYAHDNGLGGVGGGDGIYVRACTDVIVTDNICAGNNRIGIVVDATGGVDSNRIMISDNLCIDNGVNSANPPAGIWVETDGNCVIEGNIVWTDLAAETRGIVSSHAAGYCNLICDNTIYGVLAHTRGMRLAAGDKVQDNRIYNCYFGMDLSSGVCSDITIQNNTIEDIYYQGIGLAPGAPQNFYNMKITGNFIKNCGRHGTTDDGTEAAIHCSTNATLYDCDISDNTIIDDQGTPTTYHGVYISKFHRGRLCDNIIKGAEDDGIYLPGSVTESDIDGNHIEDPGADGILALNILDSSISRNKVFDAAADGIRLRDAQFCHICENQIQDCGSEGIYLYEDTRDIANNVINDNIINNCTAEGIEIVPSAANTFDYNIIEGSNVTGCSVGILTPVDGRADWNIILGNNFAGNTATSDIDAGTWGANSVIDHNINP